MTAGALDLVSGNLGSQTVGGVNLMPGPDSTLLSRFVDSSVIARTNPWLYAVIDLVARNFGRMPPKAYAFDSDGDQVRAVEAGGVASRRGAELERVLRNPGRGVSWVARQRGLAWDRLTHGNALEVVHRESTGLITGLERIPWNHVGWSDLDGEVAYYDNRQSMANRRMLTSEDVYHWGLWSDGDRAVAGTPIQALSSTLQLFDVVYTHIIAYFGNSARPSGHFKLDKQVSKDVLDAVAAEIRAAFAGGANAGKVLVTSAEYEPMSTTPDQSKVIELAKQSREEICGVYGVSPPLVGILDRAIMSNVRELREHTTRDTVGPHVEHADADWNAQLRENHSRYASVWLESEQSAPLRADPEGASATFPNQLRIRTPNELRQKYNLKRLEDDPAADQIWSPNSGDPDETPEPEPTPSGMFAPMNGDTAHV